MSPPVVQESRAGAPGAAVGSASGEARVAGPGFPRLTLLGLSIDIATERQVISHVIAAARDGIGGAVITPNLDQLRHFHRDKSLHDLYREASLVVADGMPLVWASRIAFGRAGALPERVAGSALTVSLTAAAAEAGIPVFLLGGNPGAAELAAEKLRAASPALILAGTHCPPLGFEQSAAAMGAIREAIAGALAPHGGRGIVYVGLGFPKQERLIQRLRADFPQAWFLGIGISLSFVAGEVPRAPRWAQKAGLEWLHRLAHEPRRLFKRYIIQDLPFAARLLAHAAARRVRR